LSLSNAIRERDVAQLPSKRDEDWRWTDLRGLLRTLPEPSDPLDVSSTGPFDLIADVTHLVANGSGAAPIEVAPGQTSRIGLRFIASGVGSHAATTRITVGADARLVILETYESNAGSVSQTSISISLGEGASVERIVLCEDDDEAISVSLAEVALGARSSFHQTLVSSGARRQRLETRVLHPGAKAELRLDGVYLISAKRHGDQTSVVTHAGPDGVTTQLTKGVVQDQARGIFQGKIVVEEGADRTDARMGHHALILSDRAEVDAKPELEIYADDVACAHGNTVGALDENAMFYARQRGMSQMQAQALLTEAFIGEVVERIGDEAAREVIQAWVTERLRT